MVHFKTLRYICLIWITKNNLLESVQMYFFQQYFFKGEEIVGYPYPANLDIWLSD